MSDLAKLKAVDGLEGLASLLGFSANGLAYVLYKMPLKARYSVFEIPKRNGGTRTIHAPAPQLREAQKRLAKLLQRSLTEVENSASGRATLAHGFLPNRSIMTNATLHKNRRYVLNLDLEDFFPSFNFGRVRGFF